MSKWLRVGSLSVLILVSLFVALSALSGTAVSRPLRSPDGTEAPSLPATPVPLKLDSSGQPEAPAATRGLPPDSDCSDGQCVFYVTASADDAGDAPGASTCTYSTSNQNLYFGECSTTGGSLTTGFIFRGIQLPQYAQITQAYIEYTTDGPYSDQDIQLNYYGEKGTNPLPFSLNDKPSTRVSNSDRLVNPNTPIPWHVKAGTVWELNEVRTSPDLTAIVQAIVNQSEWTGLPPNKAISIIATTGGPATGPWRHRRVIGWDRDSSNAPRLVIRLKSAEALPAFTPENTTYLRLLGNAKIYTPDLALRLTELANQRGIAWNLLAQNVTKRFETVFDFRLSGRVGRGGDGFAFVMHNQWQGPYAIGSDGCELGYGGLDHSLAIEFDTAANPPDCAYLGDPNGNHISVQTGFTATNSADITHSLALATPSVTLADGQWHTAKISYMYDPAHLTGTLKVYVDQIGVITAPLILTDVLALDSGTVWVGFTSASSSGYEIHDIMNLHLAPTYDLTCLEYSFEGGKGNGFQRDTPGAGSLTASDGWRTAWDPKNSLPTAGRLDIQRGMTSDTQPLLADLFPNLNELPPIKQVRLEYSWSPDGHAPVRVPPTSATANVTVELKSSSGPTPERITKLISPATEAPSEKNQFTTRFDFDNVVQPIGLRLNVALAAITQVIYVKKVGLCFEGGAPPRPPVMPQGASMACHNLLTNLKSRSQPFGPPAGTAQQPEFQFPSDVTLEPYLDYNLNAQGYPASLTYGSGNEATLVACTFKKAGQYHPDPVKPIVRFTAVGGNATQREQLVLLNYAGYFSVGSPNWCYANDNVFATMNDRYHSDRYGFGYNVPTPAHPCNDESGGGWGPCGTFFAAVYRAMGYFSVDGIAAAYQNPIYQSTVVSSMGTVYYNVPYDEHLRDNTYATYGIKPLLVRADPTATSYVTQPVSFTGIRAYPAVAGCTADPATGFCPDGPRVYDLAGVDPITCVPSTLPKDKDPCEQARKQTWLHWTDPLTVTLFPSYTWPRNYTAEGVWRAIKPGDIAITVIEKINTHVQIVVGWGPKPGTDLFLSEGTGTRYGRNLYPTYDNIPSDKGKYVPYVMDRYKLPGTGSVTGPRPFNYGLSSTATSFWVANYAPTGQASTFDETRRQTPQLTPFSDRAIVPARDNVASSLPLPIYVPGSVAWSPDGNWIALGNQYGIALYTPDLSHTLPVTNATSTVMALAWSPNSTKLASAEAAQQVTIWNVSSGTRLATLKGHSAQMTSVAWSPDGTQIASGSKDGTIRIWNANNFALSMTLPYTGSGYVNALVWSPDSDRLAASDATAIYIWNMTTGQLVTSFDLEPWPSGSLSWTSDGQFLITPGARRWDVTTGEVADEYPACSSGTDTFATLSPSGRSLAGIGLAATGSSACINQLDAQYHPLGQTYLQTYDSIDTIGTAAWSPDSQHVAFSTQSGWLYLSEVTSGTLQAVAPRLTTTPDELDTLVSRCVIHDSWQIRLIYLLLTGDYTTFVTEAQSQPDNIVNSSCKQQLTKTAEFLSNNSLLPPPAATTAQPLSLQYTCSTNSNEWVWRVRNPNSYDVSVRWGWADQWPTLNGFPFVVPAAHRSVSGEWLIATPAQTGTRTLKILSGGFVATAQSRIYCTDIWLPLILKRN